MIGLAQAAGGWQLPPVHVMVSIAIVIFLAIGLHEFAHAKFADLAGDPTPGMYGRVTLDLTKHFELMGTIFIVLTTITGFGIGWGKPVPMDPRKMRNPRWDHFVAVAAGPISNLLQAVVYALLFRVFLLVGVFTPTESAATIIGTFLILGILINVSLFLFNLLPIGPLDGMWLLGTFMPDPMRLSFTRFNQTYGGFLFLGLILFGQATGGGIIRGILEPPSEAIVSFLIGQRR